VSPADGKAAAGAASAENSWTAAANTPPAEMGQQAAWAAGDIASQSRPSPHHRKQAWDAGDDVTPAAHSSTHPQPEGEPEVVKVRLDWPGGVATQQDRTQQHRGVATQQDRSAVQQPVDQPPRWAQSRRVNPRGAREDSEEEDQADAEEEREEDDEEEEDEDDEETLASARDTARHTSAEAGRGVGAVELVASAMNPASAMKLDAEPPLPTVSSASKAPRAIYNKDAISSEEESDDE